MSRSRVRMRFVMMGAQHAATGWDDLGELDFTGEKLGDRRFVRGVQDGTGRAAATSRFQASSKAGKRLVSGGKEFELLRCGPIDF